MQNIEILKKDVKINRVFFLSDIHIRNEITMEKQYYYVFENLFKELEKDKINENDLICITGDIMDNGYILSPHSIKMAKFLYHKLTEMCSVITILGNHDAKLDIDSLSPVIGDYFKTTHTSHILFDNKIYVYGNVAFGHTKFDATSVTSCKDLDSKYHTIALFHGILNGSSFDNNYTVSSRSHFSLKDFKEYKYCAFGDLHKQQWLNTKKTAFYTGSLVSQKRNEDAFLHGYVTIDLNNEKTSFTTVHNKYKILDLKMEDDGTISNYDMKKVLSSTEYADIQISFNKYDKDKIDNIKNIFKKNDVIITNFMEKPKFETIHMNTNIKINDNEISFSKITNRDEFTNFFMEFIKNKNSKIDDEKRMIDNINKLLEESNIEENLKVNRDLKIHDIVINNIMVFGENVKIDISKLNGITGMCETNSMGKSTLCELISIILFAESPRCDKHASFIRMGETYADGTITLTSNNEEYEIKRIFKKHGKYDMTKPDNILYIKKYINKEKNIYKMYSNAEYIKTDKNDKDSTNEWKKKDKNKLIKRINKHIITYDEIYEILIVSQERENSFLKSKNKVEFLFKLTNLSFLNIITVKSANICGTIKAEITNTINKYISDEFKEIETKKKTKRISNKSKNDDDINDKKNVAINVKLDNIKYKIQSEEENIKNTSDNINKTYYEIEKKFDDNCKEIIKYEERLKNYNEFDDLDDCDIDDLKIKIDEIKQYLKNNDIANIKKELVNTEKKIKLFQLKINKYGNIEEDNNKFEEDKKNKISVMNKNINNLNKQIKLINSNIISKKIMNENKKNNIKMNNELINIEKNIENIKYKLNVQNDKNTFVNYKKYFDKFCEIYLYERQLDMYNTINNNILKETINNQIDIVTNLINDEKKELEKLIQYKSDYEIIGSNENYNEQLDILIKNKKDIINNINNNESEIEKYLIHEENINIEKQIEKIENDIINENNKKNKKYNEYVNIFNEFEEYEKKVNQLKLKLEKKINENLKKENEMNDYITIVDKIQKNSVKYKKYCEIKTEYENIIKISNNIKKEFEIIKKEKNDIDSKNKIMHDKIIISKKILEKCNDLIIDLHNYKIISNSLSNDGLGDTIFKDSIIRKLQETVDNTCTYIKHEKIYINIVNKSENSYKKYDIVISTDKCKDVCNVGGFQFNIIELIFKLAFLKINCYFKSSFIIIDEIFDACSNENKDMAVKLIDYFGSQYDKILLVSHNHTIINTFNKRLVILKDSVNGNSIIQS